VPRRKRWSNGTSVDVVGHWQRLRACESTPRTANPVLFRAEVAPLPPLQLGTEFRFSSACIEAAASYFDRLMSAVRVDRSQLQTAALACVLIATKQHETGGQALTFKLVRERMASITTTEALAKMEIEVLFALKWDANAFTAVQFVQCVTSFIVTPHAARDVCTTAEHFLQTALKREYRRRPQPTAGRKTGPLRPHARPLTHRSALPPLHRVLLPQVLLLRDRPRRRRCLLHRSLLPVRRTRGESSLARRARGAAHGARRNVQRLARRGAA